MNQYTDLDIRWFFFETWPSQGPLAVHFREKAEGVETSGAHLPSTLCPCRADSRSLPIWGSHSDSERWSRSLAGDRSKQNEERKAISDIKSNERIKKQTQFQEDLYKRSVSRAARRKEKMLSARISWWQSNPHMGLSVTCANRKKNLDTWLEWRMKMQKKACLQSNHVCSNIFIQLFSLRNALLIAIWKWAFLLRFKLCFLNIFIAISLLQIFKCQ